VRNTAIIAIILNGNGTTIEIAMLIAREMPTHINWNCKNFFALGSTIY